MSSPDFLYGFDSATITLILFLLILLFNEVGYRAGRFVQAQSDDEVKSQIGTIQGSILGLLALLLGFTFSMSMQRFDQRSQAVISEANAIGTAVLRVKLLPPKYQDETSRLLHRYVELRVAVSGIDLTQQEERRRTQHQTGDLQGALWQLAADAAHADPRPVTTGMFVNALNEMFDSQGRRNALLQLHIPELVWLLLFVVFVSSGGMLGYSSGLTGRRIIAPALLVSLLISLVVFLIIDLDRPRRGLIQVNQGALIDLQQVPSGVPDTEPAGVLPAQR